MTPRAEKPPPTARREKGLNAGAGMLGRLGRMAAVPLALDEEESAREEVTRFGTDCAITAEEATTKRNERQETGSFTTRAPKRSKIPGRGLDRKLTGKTIAKSALRLRATTYRVT